MSAEHLDAHEILALSWFLSVPFCFFCLQYGLDMFMEGLVPMSEYQIKRRIEHGF